MDLVGYGVWGEKKMIEYIFFIKVFFYSRFFIEYGGGSLLWMMVY